MAAKLSRYLGVQPFKTTDRHIFFGRDEDIENLHDFILLEKLVVLFGKSGYGKSSLLNAGIMPRLMDDKQPAAFQFRPIEVRFTTYIEGQSITPLETMKRLVRDIPREKNADFLSDFTDGTSRDNREGDTLWLQFKQRQTVANGQFVLIFDQFEELFSYPVEQQETFRKQLAELFYTDIPQSVRAKLDTLSDEQRRYVAKPMNVKAVFAIRSDRMSLLDSMKDVMPAILHKRYELHSLTTKQARKAIVEPAKLEQGDTFASPAFEYTEGGLDAIIKALTTITTESKETTTTGIEAFQLQIVCEYIEGLVKEEKVPDIDGNGLPDITEAQLPKMAKLYEDYYHRKLSELDMPVRLIAQKVLEDALLAEDTVTGEGRRKSVDRHDLIQMGLTENLLMDLEKTYLIRREVNTVGGFSFEISHDTLVAPIQKAKKERKEVEEKERLAQEQIEKEKQLAEAKAQAAKDRRSKQIAYGLSIAALFGLAIAVWQFLAAREANRNVVYMLVREADKSILSLDYDAALEKCQTALGLGVANDSINQRLQEIAYFYTETDTFKAALNTLNLMNIYADTNRTALRAAIQKMSPSYFDSLEHRYYPQMISVEGGKFKMDSTYQVEVSSFKIAKTETTVWQYFVYLKSKRQKPYNTPAWQYSGDNPMIYVSWDDAIEYNNWLSERMQMRKIYTVDTSKNAVLIDYNAKGYRLPTEAEWEFAARGGNLSKGFEFSGDSVLTNVAWFNDNSNSRTHSVATKKINELGLFDMSGNVWEWCNDWYAAYDISQKENPRGAGKGSSRVVRGGSWVINDDYCRVSVRYLVSAVSHDSYIGFRCVRYD
ncbi:MAG: SUMF1/EgtB/PvdO family nonheme iron enzyme [Saprospiraceae bacterium]|nr:SUMF1/EgtB/PvdO family nonheme iron enzyme [Saprospiraceae bacterium]